MMTTQRMREVVTACDAMIISPNITEDGKIFAIIRREEVLNKLILYNTLNVQRGKKE